MSSTLPPETPASPTHPFAARERRRKRLGAGVIVAWLVGMALIVQRDVLIGETQRLAEAALRLSPGATFFVVEQGGAQIGFASTTIDTTTTGIDVADYFVADLTVAGSRQRASARSLVKLSRALALQGFDVNVDAPGSKIAAGGRTEGDSAVVFVLSANGAAADSQRIAVQGPILLPTVVPLVMTLGRTPEVGREFNVPTFDPTTMAQRPQALRITAESVFTVVDSARMDVARGEWVSALTDTVRAWRIEPAGPDGPGFRGWVDLQGRVVLAEQAGGITLRRMAYEIAFENWRMARDRSAATSPGAGDIVERTAIAANALAGRARFRTLTVRLGGVGLGGYALDGGRQRLSGDTLTVQVDAESALQPTWNFAERNDSLRARFRRELAAEPFLQVGSIPMFRKVVSIVGLERDPVRVAQRINRWVHDSLAKVPTFSVPNALSVLESQRGDCNEHTQLYVALARTIGLPARIATGLAYVRGKFYYHAWPEVWLNDWVAVDPTFGQFPADAGHLRFQVGGVAQQAELIRLVGNLSINVLSVQ
ncbi:MAG: transglutaminase domain-containing protein [Gemmatimonadetes bacterium]|nr:transglutaminase domain-containing protein [Gemmatimonadota bacterium]